MKCFFFFHKLVSKPSVQEPISLDVIRKHALLTLKCLWYLIVKYIYINESIDIYKQNRNLESN